MRRMTGFDGDHYAVADVDESRNLWNILWAGSLTAGESTFVPKPVTWRFRLVLVRLWVWRHLPRIHIGPCDHSDCYGED